MLYTSLAVVFLTTGAVLYIAAASQGWIAKIENLMIETGLFEQFSFRPNVILAMALVIAVFIVFVGSAINVLVAALYNLITEVVGGVQVVVLEDDPKPVVSQKPAARPAVAR